MKKGPHVPNHCWNGNEYKKVHSRQQAKPCQVFSLLLPDGAEERQHEDERRKKRQGFQRESETVDGEGIDSAGICGITKCKSHTCAKNGPRYERDTEQNDERARLDRIVIEKRNLRQTAKVSEPD